MTSPFLFTPAFPKKNSSHSGENPRKTGPKVNQLENRVKSRLEKENSSSKTAGRERTRPNCIIFVYLYLYIPIKPHSIDLRMKVLPIDVINKPSSSKYLYNLFIYNTVYNSVSPFSSQVFEATECLYIFTTC